MANLSKPLRIMKRILILLLALMPIVASAQEMIVDHTIQDVIWSKVRESQVTYDQALEHILAYRILDNVVTHGNMIAGDIVPEYIDYEAAGYSRMKVPLYLSGSKFCCRIVIRFKEGKYMAEALNMRFVDVTGPSAGLYTSFYDGHGAFAFDIAVGLVMKYLTELTTFNIPSYEW